MPDFEHFSDLLTQSSSVLAPAEVHGLLSALACVPGEGRVAALQGEVLGPAVQDPSEAPVIEILEAVWKDTYAALESTDCTFDLMLPDDEQSLQQRTEALGSWCQGFLAGLGLGGVGDHHKSLSGDAREFLNDLQEMSRIEPDPDNDEEAERAFAELVEYLRIGVLDLREEIGEIATTNAGIGRLH
jgi:uncharacterized protein